MASATRRVRVKRPTKDESKRIVTDRIDDLIAEYMAAKARADKAKADMDETIEQLAPLMKANNVEYHRGPKGVAEFKSPRSNSRTIIDPRRFHELVSEDEFFGAIDVKVTKAKELVAGNTLNKISQKTKPEKKPPVATVRPPKKDE